MPRRLGRLEDLRGRLVTNGDGNALDPEQIDFDSVRNCPVLDDDLVRWNRVCETGGYRGRVPEDD